MAAMSRKCVPFTPFDRPLSKATIGLVTAAGVHRRDQNPFNTSDDLGDLTFRIISGEVHTSDLMVTHNHYDHQDADADINVVFPLDLLREFHNEGLIGGIAAENIGFMGYTMKLRQMYEETAPAIAEEVAKRSRADAIVLTGG